MDWSLFGCFSKGHVTYAPDEPELRDRLMAQTAGGTAWRCLRCGTFVTDGPHGSGPAAAAPLVRRGKELRSELILRVFSVERFLRFLVFGAAAYGVWRFKYDRAGIQQAYNNALPAIRALYRDLGFDVNHSKLLGLIQHAFTLDSRVLIYLAIGLAAYALIELVESIGLWLAKRWGEYFAMVATSIFLPYEVYDLTVKITWLRVTAFVINLLLVLYLVATKRLFGIRGGRKAYDAMLRSESVIEVEQAALAAAAPSQPRQSEPNQSEPGHGEPANAAVQPRPEDSSATRPEDSSAPRPENSSATRPENSSATRPGPGLWSVRVHRSGQSRASGTDALAADGLPR
ncbi:MAG TPA: DUF2127 domain-containing protein [Streptosporangiaceae bacterium]